VPASISVVIPARDAAGTLGRTIASVLSQTLAPPAVLVVDDGSTDDTAAVAGSVQADVRVLAGEGRGVAAARNLGMRTATTDYVALLDADDCWQPWLLEEAAAAIAASPDAVAVFLAAAVEDDSGRPIGAHPLPDGDIVYADLVTGRVVPTTSASVVRRESALALGGFAEDLECAAGVEDLDLWFRLAAAGTCRAVSRVSAVYVVHEARDRARSHDAIAALERDRETVVNRLEQAGCQTALVSRARAVMRARTAHYWLLAGSANEARRVARSSLRARITAEGAVTFAAATVPAVLRERARALRRRVRAGQNG
jgi:glycosyltransferase involved in cell wall biosynthesis